MKLTELGRVLFSPVGQPNDHCLTKDGGDSDSFRGHVLMIIMRCPMCVNRRPETKEVGRGGGKDGGGDDSPYGGRRGGGARRAEGERTLGSAAVDSTRMGPDVSVHSTPLTLRCPPTLFREMVTNGERTEYDGGIRSTTGCT